MGGQLDVLDSLFQFKCWEAQGADREIVLRDPSELGTSIPSWS